MLPPVLNAAVPLIAIFAVTALVLIYDGVLKLLQNHHPEKYRTISVDVWNLRRRYGPIVSRLIVGAWFLYVGIATYVLLAHWFL